MDDKDFEQDLQIRDHAARIARNEAEIKRQTEALELIRDHYYPPPKKWWKKLCTMFAKGFCIIFAYLGIAETVDWLWKAREADAIAEHYAEVSRHLYAEGDLPSAISCLEKAAKLDAKETDYAMMLMFLRGLAVTADYLDNERPPTDAERARIDAMLAEATVAQELAPDNPMPYILMAQAYLLEDEKDEAVNAVEKAVELAPKVAPVRVSACAINFFTGHAKAARAHLAQAERLNPTLPLVNAWKGALALVLDRDAPKARAIFEAQILRTPRFPVVHLQLGRAILQEKNPDLNQARAAFSRALELNAKLTSAMQGMAETYERENNLVMARLWLDRALTVDAAFLPSLVARARVAMKDADAASAIADLTASLALSPFRADLYRLRAEAREKAGEAAGAQTDRRRAHALAQERVALPQRQHEEAVRRGGTMN